MSVPMDPRAYLFYPSSCLCLPTVPVRLVVRRDDGRGARLARECMRMRRLGMSLEPPFECLRLARSGTGQVKESCLGDRTGSGRPPEPPEPGLRGKSSVLQETQTAVRVTPFFLGCRPRSTQPTAGHPMQRNRSVGFAAPGAAAHDAAASSLRLVASTIARPPVRSCSLASSTIDCCSIRYRGRPRLPPAAPRLAGHFTRYPRARGPIYLPHHPADPLCTHRSTHKPRPCLTAHARLVLTRLAARHVRQDCHPLRRADALHSVPQSTADAIIAADDRQPSTSIP